MTRQTVFCALFLLVLIADNVNCNLIKADFGTKDVPIPREDIDNNDLTTPRELDVDVLPLMPDNVARETTKKCAKIGEFCTFHGECCTRACLGYMKRCVTGSGLYPDYVDSQPPRD